MDDWRLDIALFDHAYHSRPTARRVSWGALVKSLTTFRAPVEWSPGIVPEKYDERAKAAPKTLSPMWSPVVLAEGARRRLAANAEAVSAVVLDFDKGTPPDDARAPWMGWRHIVHTSWSHTEEVPKYRLVVPLLRPVPTSAWRRVWHWASGLSNGQADTQCKDPMRGYFVPVARGPYWSVVNDGPLLDVDVAHLAPSPEETRAPPAVRPRPMRAPAGDDDRMLLAVLRTDPDSRLAVAQALGATMTGVPLSARGMACPRCGCREAWFFVDITTMLSARCPHKSCGWYGTLLDLMRGDAK